MVELLESYDNVPESVMEHILKYQADRDAEFYQKFGYNFADFDDADILTDLPASPIPYHWYYEFHDLPTEEGQAQPTQEGQPKPSKRPESSEYSQTQSELDKKEAELLEKHKASNKAESEAPNYQPYMLENPLRVKFLKEEIYVCSLHKLKTSTLKDLQYMVAGSTHPLEQICSDEIEKLLEGRKGEDSKLDKQRRRSLNAYPGSRFKLISEELHFRTYPYDLEQWLNLRDASSLISPTIKQIIEEVEDAAVSVAEISLVEGLRGCLVEALKREDVARQKRKSQANCDSKITRRQNVASHDSIFTLTATLAEDYATTTIALDSKFGILDSTLCGELILSPKDHSCDSKLCGKMEVDEFILPDIEPVASLICPERLEYPDMFELSDVVPTDNINVYDAFLPPNFPHSRPVSFVVMSNLADACGLERRMRHVASIVGKDFVLVEKLVEVDEFILPDIEPVASLICPERLEYPDMFELSDVVPTDNINVYDAFLPPNFPHSRPVSFVVMSNLADACGLERRMRHVASIVGKDFVLGTKLIVNCNPEIDTGSSHPCLVTERIPEQTIAMFLNGNPHLSVKREFFKIGSYLILHNNLVWSPSDCIHYILRLHEYFMYNPGCYRRYVEDGAIEHHLFSALGFDWKDILGFPDGPLDNETLLADFRYRDALRAREDGRPGVYDQSESLRYFIRCKVCHLPASNRLRNVETMIDAIINVFPEAMTRLYYMSYRRFHFASWLRYFQGYFPRLATDYVKFFRCCMTWLDFHNAVSIVLLE
ncbi:hypothetical protein POM88_005634 [Heracleum sosnowskyi]|uniref:Uncharacterized protein n=1 Tax=Heracleum sosnowskyi TaxID=360622 RepID=A0AAD8J3V2_9APIA|nr:hypothetical protein POM88_005634 [Heracleum sosnowskyi]